MKNNRLVFRYFFFRCFSFFNFSIFWLLLLLLLTSHYFYLYSSLITLQKQFICHIIFFFWFKFNIYWHQSRLFLLIYAQNGQRILIVNIDFIWNEALTMGMAFAWHFLLVYKWAELNHGGQTGIWFNLETKSLQSWSEYCKNIKKIKKSKLRKIRFSVIIA